MSILVSNTFRLLVVLHVFFVIFSKAQENPVFSHCYDSANYTSGSQFQTNLNNLFTSLYTKAPVNGFNTTISGEDPDRVHGLVQCKGDISEDKCRNCVNTSISQIVQRCPNKMEGAIRFGDCVLRYSNENFFSQVDSEVRQSLYLIRNVSNLELFNQQLGDLMNNLTTAASSSPFKFETGTIDYGNFEKIYGLLQCTRDLSNTGCYSCLKGIIGYIPTCCSGMAGGNVFSVSCNLRYDPYPFFELFPPPPPPAVVEASPPPVPGGDDGGTAATNWTRGEKINSRIIASVVLPVATGLVLSIFICTCLLWRKTLKKKEDIEDISISSGDSLLYDLRTLKVATENFSDANKLGQGGFGPVYKGKLINGHEIAVKRLSRSSTQGLEELRNEVLLVAKLQHKNLVRLLGCCLEEQEKLLVYEYLPNSSLDRFIFDRVRRLRLDWEKRYNIIEGIARGLLYLHQDSQLRIIHRDLKASNILLDEDMNPKISDFGLARLFSGDQTRDRTKRIAGTYGYMAPEYAGRGNFSTKSDVFSFGVLVLEIVTGRKNSSFHESDSAPNLLSFVWRHWTNGTAFNVLDEAVKQPCSRNEVLRCIHIGLLCVQEDATDRPTMSAVVLMLTSYSITLSVPSQPAFYLRSRTGSNELPRESDASEYDQSATQVQVQQGQSLNNVTITELEPR